jgi:hypothetical protein
MKKSQNRSIADMLSPFRRRTSLARRVESENAFVGIVGPVALLRASQQRGERDARDEAAEMRRQATPPPPDGMNCSTVPCRSCIRNQSAAKTIAGTSKNNGTKRMGTRTMSRASGNRRMKHPRTPLIAPEAPSAGIVEVGLTTAWARREQAADEIEKEIPCGPEAVLYSRAKQPQRPHIQNQMQPASMQKHVAEKREDNR